MSDGGLTVLDGTTVRNLQLRPPETNSAITGAQLLSIAENEASSSLFDLSLPKTLTNSALKRINIDAVSFASSQLPRDEATEKLKEYVIAIADELKDDPVVITILDGSIVRLFLEDEDDFAVLAENLFMDLDVDHKGRIEKREIRNALVQMGVELGVPSCSEFPLLEDILTKHGAEGEQELGQAQFTMSLRPILQDLADALAEKHIAIIQKNIKIINGSKLRKLLANEEQLKNVINKMSNIVDSKDELGFEAIKEFLENNEPMLGLPPVEDNVAVALLYDQVFSEVDNDKPVGKLGRGQLGSLVRDIIEKFAEKLDGNPIFHGLGN